MRFQIWISTRTTHKPSRGDLKTQQGAIKRSDLEIKHAKIGLGQTGGLIQEYEAQKTY